jgi:hypothetical protein
VLFYFHKMNSSILLPFDVIKNKSMQAISNSNLICKDLNCDSDDTTQSDITLVTPKYTHFSLLTCWGSIVPIPPDKFLFKLMLSRGYNCSLIPTLALRQNRSPIFSFIYILIIFKLKDFFLKLEILLLIS